MRLRSSPRCRRSLVARCCSPTFAVFVVPVVAVIVVSAEEVAVVVVVAAVEVVAAGVDSGVADAVGVAAAVAGVTWPFSDED